MSYFDRNGEQDFKPGDQVIVTHTVQPPWVSPRGAILEVQSEPYIWLTGGVTPDGQIMGGVSRYNGWKVVTVWRDGRFGVPHPVAWLRPFKDPDGEQSLYREDQTEREADHA